MSNASTTGLGRCACLAAGAGEYPLAGARVALLAAANSIHTVRWANALAGRGLEVHLISLQTPMGGIAPEVVVHGLPCPAPLGYYANAGTLRRLLRRLRPALVNVHYASGYGTLARLARARPVLLSAWGSDIYEFPYRSAWHRRELQRNLAHATALASTGLAMAHRIMALHGGAPPLITPFGVDTERFKPCAALQRGTGGELVIGTVKGLAPVYGIDRLLHAYALLHENLRVGRHPLAGRVALRIYGAGRSEAALERLAAGLGLDPGQVFRGAVPHREVPRVLNQLDIFVALSRRESFGVAALEASACGRPIVVSDADGLAEITRHGETGFVVAGGDARQASARLLQLAGDPALRQAMGARGRAHIQQYYTWQASVEAMLDAYRHTLHLHRQGRHP